MEGLYSMNDVFYSYPSVFNWKITDSQLNALREFKPNIYEGIYVDKGLSYLFSDNEDIIKKYCPKDMSNDIFFRNCAITLRFMCSFLKIEDLSDEFVNSNNVKEYHIYLINRLIIDEYSGYLEENKGPTIYTDNKRPFGNSYMEGDVVTMYNRYLSKIGKDEVDIDDDYDNVDFFTNIYYEVIDILIEFVKICDFRYRILNRVLKTDYHKLNNIQLNRMLYNGWTIDLSETRDELISEIIK